MDSGSIHEQFFTNPYYKVTSRTSKRGHHSADNKRTLTVIAKYPDDGLYYLGKAISDGNPTEVLFPSNNGVNKSKISRKVKRDDVIPFAGATSCPPLQVWDYVLVKIGCQGFKLTPYFPGKIVGLPLERALNHDKFYSILLYTDKVVTKQRREITKITEGQYDRLIKELRKRHHHKMHEDGDDPVKNKRKHASSNTDPVIVPGVLKTPDRTPVPSRKSSVTKTPPDTPKKKDTESKEVQTDKEIGNKGQQTHKDIENKGTNTEKVEPKEEKTDIKKVDLSPVIGEEVLARWADDGWYYFGIVINVSKVNEAGLSTEAGLGAETEFGEDGRGYTVQDATGHTETVSKRYLFSEKKRVHWLNYIQKNAYIIAQHPDFPYSYAPGQIKRISSQQIATILFYDRTTSYVNTTYVYVITKEQYDEAVDYIEESQRHVMNKVIARDDTTGVYRTCDVTRWDKNDHVAVVQFTGGEHTSQNIRHIFPFYRRNARPIAEYHFVLALDQEDQNRSTYLPAQVTEFESPGKLMLVLCDKTRATVHLSDCFYINEDYYINAVNYYNNRKIFYRHEHPESGQRNIDEEKEKEDLIIAFEAVTKETEDHQKSSPNQNGSPRIDGAFGTAVKEIYRTREIASGNVGLRVGTSTELGRTNPSMQSRRWGQSFKMDGSLKMTNSSSKEKGTQLEESLVEIKITSLKIKTRTTWNLVDSGEDEGGIHQTV